MPEYLILLSPSSNAVYTEAARRLAGAELAIMLGRPEVWAGEEGGVAPLTVAGVDYLRLDGDLDDRARWALGRLSAGWAAFERVGDLLRPVAVARPDRFDDDLVTIPKYPGKTNEQFTRLLLNVTAASARRDLAGAAVLDPMSGRGTTLSVGLTLGYDVAGVEVEEKAVEAYAAFLKTYLRRKRLKHTAELTPVRREGKTLGRRLDVTVTPAPPHPPVDPLSLTVFTGDTRQSAALYGKRRFDLVVTDAPYGIVHGSRDSSRRARDRSAEGLLGETVGVWAGQLKRGGALGISWNTYSLAPERLREMASEAGLDVLAEGPYRQLGHRVDSSIHRDVLVAVKP